MPISKKLLLLCVLVGVATFTGQPRAQGPPAPTAAFHAIGDLPGGDPTFTTLVKDATRVGDTISAVGGLLTKTTPCIAPCFKTDTPFLWQFNGTTATLTALPDLTVPNAITSNITASAITPDGAYIASQARLFVPNVPPATGGTIQARAVRVTTSPITNLDLSAFSPSTIAAQFPVSISEDGTIIYGFSGVRLDTNTSTKILVPRVCPAVSLPDCPAADTNIIMAGRGVSADGNAAVGSSASGTIGARVNVKAFRYVHDPVTSSGVSTAIPRLPGGTYNDALAVSPDGNRVLVIGNSTDYPNGEAYLYDVSKPIGSRITRLGSPNAPWSPGARLCTDTGGCQPAVLSVGGLSDDGSVVAMSFRGNDGQYGYFRNVNGWFHLTSALGAQGIDIASDGWDLETLQVQGMSPDGTLVWGSGAHRRPDAPLNSDGHRLNDTEGFVAVFPAGFLASFNPQPTPPPPAYTGLIGAWSFVDSSAPGGPPPLPDAPDHMVIFTAEGVYYHVEGAPGNPLAGFERGRYQFAGDAVALTTLFDSNGSTGLSSDNGTSYGPVAVIGDELVIGGDVQARRIVGGPGSIVGGWIGGDPTQAHNGFLLSFAATGYTLIADQPDGTGSEVGTYTWDPVSHEVIATLGSEVNDGNFVTLSANERELFVLDDIGESFTLTRVIDPRTPVITSALTATIATGLPFAYQITGTNGPSAFGATGLPPGLNIDTTTGLISGSPPFGTFDIRIEASNLLSTSTGVNRLTLTVTQTAAVTLGETVVIPIPAEEGELPPVTIEFSNVTSGGEITISTIDPELAPSAPEPPAGFSLGDDPVYYEITPSPGLTFEGPVEVCFSYAGITFAGVPRLLHYEVALASWVDITTTVDVATSTVCGLTSSFSPFAMAASALRPVGFHQPIEPVAGALNTAKGGATVALRFNIYDDGGVEITDPSQIENVDFVVSRITCETGAFEDAVPFETSGKTGLRYDATSRQFVQNWQTPRTPGMCYLVKVTGDGLLLSARFKLR